MLDDTDLNQLILEDVGDTLHQHLHTERRLRRRTSSATRLPSPPHRLSTTTEQPALPNNVRCATI